MPDLSHADDAQLQQRLAHKFSRPELLDQALTHSSVVPENRVPENRPNPAEPATPRSVANNERLEFLGDAVLELLTSEYLLSAFPDWSEGQLSKSRARFVNAHSLEAAARRLHLGDHLRLGRGEEKTGGRDKQTLLADAFEAVIAAVYLDAGLSAARDVLRKTLFEHAIEEGGQRMDETDRKSALQELLQGRGQVPAEYRVARESGPDHQKTFEIEVWINGSRIASAEGGTKKEAEQRAARKALALLEQPE
jgi:ribonuclease III